MGGLIEGKGLNRGGGVFHKAEFWRGFFLNNKSNLGKSNNNITLFPQIVPLSEQSYSYIAPKHLYYVLKPEDSVTIRNLKTKMYDKTYI